MVQLVRRLLLECENLAVISQNIKTEELDTVGLICAPQTCQKCQRQDGPQGLLPSQSGQTDEL